MAQSRYSHETHVFCLLLGPYIDCCGESMVNFSVNTFLQQYVIHLTKKDPNSRIQ